MIKSNVFIEYWSIYSLFKKLNGLRTNVVKALSSDNPSHSLWYRDYLIRLYETEHQLDAICHVSNMTRQELKVWTDNKMKYIPEEEKKQK